MDRIFWGVWEKLLQKKNLASTALAQNEHGNLGRGGDEHSEAQVNIQEEDFTKNWVFGSEIASWEGGNGVFIPLTGTCLAYGTHHSSPMLFLVDVTSSYPFCWSQSSFGVVGTFVGDSSHCIKCYVIYVGYWV